MSHVNPVREVRRGKLPYMCSKQRRFADFRVRAVECPDFAV